jgi:hypothetical protein
VIDAEFIVPAAKAIQKALLVDLHIFDKDGNKRCAELLAEPESKRRRREDLAERKERLGKAKVAIRKFNMA